MDCCNKKAVDFSYKRFDILDGKTTHYYCIKCGCHHHDGKKYTADEWFFYINGVSYEEYQNQLIMEESPHAHELVNRSNPENYHD